MGAKFKTKHNRASKTLARAPIASSNLKQCFTKHENRKNRRERDGFEPNAAGESRSYSPEAVGAI